MSKNTPSEFAAKYVNLASAKFGAKVTYATDDFFAAKERLIEDAAPISRLGVFDDHGQWMDGWESRRKRGGGHDHCIISLWSAGKIEAVNIDTSFFTGNQPMAASIESCAGDDAPTEASVWTEIVAETTLKPNAEHIIKVTDANPYNWLRLNMFPDGGIARLRVYGTPFCDWENRDSSALYELSALKNAGRIIAYNDAHYGSVWSLLSEGRGTNMDDGWETRRRREPGNDWIIIKLGHSGTIEKIELDTAHYKGNYPDGFSLEAAYVDDGEGDALDFDSLTWKDLLSRQKLSADSQHFFKAAAIKDICPVTYVRMNIYPDGGVSRLRLWGKLSGR